MTQTAQEIHSEINKKWIFLYTQSTVSVFANSYVLTNIHNSKDGCML